MLFLVSELTDKTIQPHHPSLRDFDQGKAKTVKTGCAQTNLVLNLEEWFFSERLRVGASAGIAMFLLFESCKVRRTCSVVGRKMVEARFQPDSWREQNEGTQVPSSRKVFSRFLFPLRSPSSGKTNSAGPISRCLGGYYFVEDFGQSPVSVNQSSPFIRIQRLPGGVNHK